MKPDFKCQVEGCDNYVTSYVEDMDANRKYVCEDCADYYSGMINYNVYRGVFARSMSKKYSGLVTVASWLIMFGLGVALLGVITLAIIWAGTSML